MRKLFVLGLDSLPPKVLYENYGEGLDFIREIVKGSQNYLMRTCHPPITIPAWMSMFTGKTPGELGIYGFRHRKPGTFDSYVVNSADVKLPAIWDDLGKKGIRSGLFGVPPTYPPKPINGFMVTDFNTPSADKPYTFPPWLKSELRSSVGDPIFDVVYRTENRDKAYSDLMEMIDNHQKILNYLIKKTWDLFIYVEIGVDRSHHMFWKYFDKDHPRYEYHEKFSNAIPQVYKKIDTWFSSIVKQLPKDTIYVIVSDHGTKSMKGSYPINQWLIEQGFLKLKSEVKEEGVDLTPDIIDWNETKTWAWGGYYSRFFLNIKGREPYGIVKREEVESLIKDLKNSISKIRGPNGEIWKNEAYTPQEIYPEIGGDAPDLTVYLDDLNWRPIGTIGYKNMYQEKNDKGPDDSMHDWYGVFSIYDPEETLEKGERGVIEINKIRSVLEELILK